jgi:signal peptidase I
MENKKVAKFIDYLKSELSTELLKTLLCALLLALTFRSFVFDPYKIPTGSMKPNLLIGDHLFVAKYAYGYSRYSLPFGLPLFEGRIFAKQPERGDIVVFRAKDGDDKAYYIKRITGLPGDTLQMKMGVLHVNGKAVLKRGCGEFVDYERNGRRKVFTKCRERLPNSVTHITIYDDRVPLDQFPNTTEVYKVPEDHYFMMGDNRNNSKDSRWLDDMAYVPFDRLIGRAYFMLWTEDLSLKDLIFKGEKGRSFHLIKNNV